mmetsp:Transcript_65229/g.181322  ORF Transcript_65229/g.181322 Transcript_65229/m.181322 type:complete len:226 (+) Transcript_65229:2910-3587(+)
MPTIARAIPERCYALFDAILRRESHWQPRAHDWPCAKKLRQVGSFEDDAAEWRLLNAALVEVGKLVKNGLRKQSEVPPVDCSSSAAATLQHGCAGTPFRHERGHACLIVVDTHAVRAEINHRVDARHCKRRLRNVGGEHHAPDTTARGFKRLRVVILFQRGMHHVYLRLLVPEPLRLVLHGVLDLPHLIQARQKDQRNARRFFVVSAQISELAQKPGAEGRELLA